MELDPKAVAHEAHFWRGFVKTERFAQWCANHKTPELRDEVALLLRYAVDNSEHSPFRILDVGSGPVSILHGLFEDSRNEVIIDTADPLSPTYQDIFDYDRANIRPPMSLGAETVHLLCESRYDVVHISNALDHVVHVEDALKSMASCFRRQPLGGPDGMLIVQGFVDEADHERFQGFHQHNLSLDGENLKWRGVNFTTVIRPQDIGMRCLYATQSLTLLGRQWFLWVLVGV